MKLIKIIIRRKTKISLLKILLLLISISFRPKPPKKINITKKIVKAIQQLELMPSRLAKKIKPKQKPKLY